MMRHVLLGVVWLCGVACGGAASAGEPALLDSGEVIAPGGLGGAGAQAPVWSGVVEIEGARWVRLRFGEARLSRADGELRESYLRLTSLEDGHEQYLDAGALEEWGHTSAYFNGGAVRVELMASPGHAGRVDRVRVVGVETPEDVAAGEGARSLCGTDDRVLGDDPGVGRVMPGGCSAFLFGDHGSTMLGAGSCSPAGGDVIEFNVPLSGADGSYRHPAPSDQYVVDGESVQRSAGGGQGENWAFFGVLDNSTTGLAPLAAQAGAFTLSEIAPPAGSPVGVLGYGRVDSGADRTWSGALKTSSGTIVGVEGDALTYRIDTTTGDAGAPVFDVFSGVVVGIHAGGGCLPSGEGENWATSVLSGELANALANPTGICQPRGVRMSYVTAPRIMSPDEPAEFRIRIEDPLGKVSGAPPVMFIDRGEGFEGHEMAQVSEQTYRYDVAPLLCGSVIRYYFEVLDTRGELNTLPAFGAGQPSYAYSLDAREEVYAEDFEDGAGWQGGGGSGGWTLGRPDGDGINAPAFDADASGRCFVTGAGDDVDGGSVVLSSPTFDVSQIEGPVLRCSLWMTGEAGDAMRVELRGDPGTEWVEIASLSHTGGWAQLSHKIEGDMAQSTLLKLRVTVTDGGEDSEVEGAVDAFSITSEACVGRCPYDFNGDGVYNFFDISIFLSAFAAQDSLADLNGDGAYNFFDVVEIVGGFTLGCGRI